MSSKEEIQKERERKLELLRDAGCNPYPSKSQRTHTIADVISEFDSFVESETETVIAGRIMSLRRHGGSTFADIFDGFGRIQIFIGKDDIGEDSYTLFTDAIDPSDFIEVKGIPFVTKRGEKTIKVLSWSILTKALQAVPSEWYGIEDSEERYRKRYLDLLQDGDLRALFAQKALFWDSVRNFMKSHGFLEVETPTLEVTTGGAEARPFKTHHNDFDMDVFMRISIGELWQKRLMAAGFPKTFEIGRAYRNEGTSPEHLQEFTNMEFYLAFADYKDGMKLVQDLYRTVATEVFGKTEFTARGHTFDLSAEWPEIDYGEEIKKQTGIDIYSASESDMESKLRELGVKYEGKNRERLMDTLWKYCRKNIAGPAFLVHHPKLVAPLAKARADGNTVEMFQPIIAGSEVGRGYSELNDPLDQRARFEVQQGLLAAGDDEAMMPEWEFVDMLEYGMPPTCGFGFGERFFAFLVDKPLREVQLFPLMRPKKEENKEEKE
ncbi:lysine--tRNA ligase [Patescibacteria group bacterium]|nr:lysine--tRNA ligase [Patescibacteria group bacterium]